MRNLFLLASLFMLGLSGSAQSLSLYEVNSFAQYQKVLTMAVEDSKMMVCIVYEEDGNLEKMIRGGVFRDSTLKARFANTLPMAIRVDSEMGAKLVENIGILALPSISFFTEDELLVNILEGPQTAAGIVAGLDKAKSQAERFQLLRKKYQNGDLSPQEWRELIEIYELNFSYNESERLALQYLQSVGKEQWFKAPNQSLLLTYGRDLQSPYATAVLAQRHNIDSADWHRYYENTYNYNFERAVANDDTVLLADIIRVLIPSMAVDSIKAELQFETAISYAEQTGNFAVWKRAALAYADEIDSASEKSKFLFDEAFEIANEYNDTSALQASGSLARASNEIMQSYKATMLEAYMAYLLKEYSKAQALVKKAMAISSGNSEQRKAEGLLRMIEQELPAQSATDQ